MATEFSFVAAEEKVLAFWDAEQIFARSMAQRQQAPEYIIYDGPPFATGLPHHGHLLASTIKDIIPRYFTMRGYHVRRRFGWDCHGLPIEHEINKSLGLSAQEAVEQLGVGGYNDACRAIVERYTAQWQATITRLGRWVTFDGGYRTMDPTYMESVWWAFAKLWDKDLVYHGEKVMPYSTALGTGLSNFEASSNYQMVQDPSVMVLFALQDEPCDLVIWTTTPWTLPSNLAICVGPDIAYVKVQAPKAKRPLIVAQSCLDQLPDWGDYSVLETFLGQDLQGRPYEPLFDYFADWRAKGAFVILTDDFVSTDEGTGLVHCAPGFGEDDYRVTTAANIEGLVCPIDAKGCLTDALVDYQGLYIKDADKAILKDLKARGCVLMQTVIEHSYPFCPRSDTPLIYRAMPSWFIQVTALKERLIECNQSIHWVPAAIGSGRFGHWLEQARDWAVSRRLVWGTPIPIWINDVTANTHCVGSLDELEALSGVRPTDLHREHIDPITFTKDGEAGVYRRIDSVFDCWFESAAMPLAQDHYPFSGKALQLPADFIAEGLDQTRGWFYTLLVLGVALFDQAAFKNVLVSGIVVAKDGKKMSKRLQNYTPPDALMAQSGADALRLYLIHSGLVKAQSQRFDDQGVMEMTRQVCLPWYNAVNFLKTYAEVDGWTTANCQPSDHILDGWLQSRVNHLTATIEGEITRYALYAVVPELLRFLEDLTNVYIRLNRSRFWAEGLGQDKCQAYTTLYDALEVFNRAMAPFTPFLAETLYQTVQKLAVDLGPISVHLCDYPQSTQRHDPGLEQAVAVMMAVLNLGRQARTRAKVKVKIPLETLTIYHRDSDLLAALAPLKNTIADELNVKQVVFCQDESRVVSYRALPNAPLLGQTLGANFKAVAQAVKALTSDAIIAFEQSGVIDVAGVQLDRLGLIVQKEPLAGSGALSHDLITIVLDTQPTPAGLQEGLAREVINRIQKTRKAMDLSVSDRIHVQWVADGALKEAIEAHQALIQGETLATSLTSVASDQPQIDYAIDAYTLGLTVTVVTPMH